MPTVELAPSRLRRRRLRRTIAALTVVTTLLLLVLGAIELRSVSASHRSATDAARADLAALEDAANLQALLYQKGFVAAYFLTGEQRWLDETRHSRVQFDGWIEQVTRHARPKPQMAVTMAALVAEYGRYDADRARAVDDFDAGRQQEAVHSLVATDDGGPHLGALTSQLIHGRRDEVMARLRQADRVWAQALVGLALAIGLAVATVVGAGYLLWRRFARPLYELVLRAESAVGGARVEVSADDEIDAVSQHVARLAQTIEASSESLAEQRARLMQAEKMSALAAMAAGVAHEVLNPLTGVKAALQQLDRTHGSLELRETVVAVNEEVGRVERMARDLMAFARPARPRLQSVELDQLLARVLATARVAAEARQVRIDVRVDGLRAITADPDLIAQALIHIVVNACQATAEHGGEVVIRGRAERGWTVLEVIDGGQGLSREVASRLFTPLVTDKRDGHGLGLAMAQNVALAHGGRIEAQSNRPPARGMTFALWLPEERRPYDSESLSSD